MAEPYLGLQDPPEPPCVSLTVSPPRRMAEGGSGSSGSPGSLRPGVPGARGVLGRRPAAPALSPGRLPSIRSRDLTLGGVKKKTFTPNIIGRKIKEEPREDVSVKKEKKERERQRDGHGRGRGRPEVIQSHSIFEQGPAEMMKKKAGSWDKTVDMSDFGPSHIINIKKEKRETDEETKQILRMLQKDDFLDDPGLKNDIRNKPVQLPLAHSGWLFKEEAAEQEDTQPWLPVSKEEKMELDPPAVKVKEEPREEDPKAAQPKGPPRIPAGCVGGRAAAAAEPGGRGGAGVPAAARHPARPAPHPRLQTHQIRAAQRGRAGGGGEAGEEPGGEAGGEHLHPGRPPRGAGGETAHPKVGKGAAGAGQGDPGCDHGHPLLLPTGAGVRRHRGQPDGRDDCAGPRAAQAGLLPGFRGSPGAPAPVAKEVPAPQPPGTDPQPLQMCLWGVGRGLVQVWAQSQLPPPPSPAGGSGCAPQSGGFPPVPNGDLWMCGSVGCPPALRTRWWEQDTRPGGETWNKTSFPPAWGCSVLFCHLC
uniref:RNA polymerase III subunit D n=1 Tax=Corvus moneduloides TaxID=1196302 RepID=A0A8U7P7H2_CORMO